MPVPTVREVRLNAMASVRFLEELGESMVDSSSMGIDYAGRLFQIRHRPRQHNFREAFIGVVLDIRTQVELRDQMKKVQNTLAAITDWGNEHDCLRRSLPELLELDKCARVMMEETKFSISKLESIMTGSEKAVKELDRIISVVNSVKQDLIDTGSTTLSRWNELKTMEWFFTEWLRSRIDGMVLNELRKLAQSMAELLMPWQRLLGLAMNLKERAEEAIDGTHEWWYTLKRTSSYCGVEAPLESSLLT